VSATDRVQGGQRDSNLIHMMTRRTEEADSFQYLGIDPVCCQCCNIGHRGHVSLGRLRTGNEKSLDEEH
jgi:hypothetical protein